MSTSIRINAPPIIMAMVIVAILATMLANLIFCFRPRTTPIAASCIQIPKELSSEEEKRALDIRSQLEAAVKSKSDVAAKFDMVVLSSFARLSDRNMTLYIFAQAINCYLKKGDPASQEMAKVMTEILRAELARSNLHGPLTAEEEAEIKKSPYANLILERFSTLR
jgi:hypothetical protein